MGAGLKSLETFATLPPFAEAYVSINGSKKMGLIMACTVQG
jgi:hypothetical protein